MMSVLLSLNFTDVKLSVGKPKSLSLESTTQGATLAWH
jgi:hypothetical protein